MARRPRTGIGFATAERDHMVAVNTLLAPLAADDDDLSHPPLVESESIRQHALALRDEMRVRGCSWKSVHAEVSNFLDGQETPVAKTFKKRGAMSATAARRVARSGG